MLPNYQARSPYVLKHTTSWRASVASETLTGVTQSKIGDVSWRASEASETVLGVDNAKSSICYWRASEASETLSGVTQSRFRYIYLFSERAKRAKLTISLCSIEISDIYIYIYM